MLPYVLLFVSLSMTVTPTTSKYLPENCYLVKADAVRGKDVPGGGGIIDVTLKISEVYNGPAALKGMCFECFHDPFHNVRMGPHIDNLPIGVTGLWWVKISGNFRLTPIPVPNPYDIMKRFPYLDDLLNPDPRHAFYYPPIGWIRVQQLSDKIDAAAWGRFMNELYVAADDNQRRQLLKNYTQKSRVPAISAYAVHLLGGQDDDSRAFLLQLIKRKTLPEVVQVTIDRVLCQVLQQSWSQSAEREKLFKGWLYVEPSEPSYEHFRYGLRRIEESLQAGEVNLDWLHHLIPPRLNEIAKTEKSVQQHKWLFFPS